MTPPEPRPAFPGFLNLPKPYTRHALPRQPRRPFPIHKDGTGELSETRRPIFGGRHPNLTDQVDAAARARARLAELREEATQRATSWLLELLTARVKEMRRNVYKQAELASVSAASVERAAQELGVVATRPGKEVYWALPRPEPKPQGFPTVTGKGEFKPRAPLPEELRVLRKAPTTAMAAELLRRKAYHKTLALLELTEREQRDAVKCPSCGRGMLRAEETRLRAILAVLDRAGMGAKDKGEGGGESGPLIVFPPGTKIGIVAQTSTEAERRAADATRDAKQAIEVAVEAEAESIQAQMLARATAAVERVQARRVSEI